MDTFDKNEAVSIFRHLSPYELKTIIHSQHERLDDDKPNDQIHHDIFNLAVDYYMQTDSTGACIEYLLDN